MLRELLEIEVNLQEHQEPVQLLLVILKMERRLESDFHQAQEKPFPEHAEVWSESLLEVEELISQS